MPTLNRSQLRKSCIAELFPISEETESKLVKAENLTDRIGRIQIGISIAKLNYDFGQRTDGGVPYQDLYALVNALCSLYPRSSAISVSDFLPSPK